MGTSASTAIIIITSVLFALSLFTVCLRCVVRLRLVKAFGSDDICMIIAMVRQAVRTLPMVYHAV